jgi:modulator of FtsH protease HflK
MTAEANRTGPADAGGKALNEALQTAFRLLRWLMVLIVVFYVASGVFVVRQHEKAIVLLMGRVQGFGDERVLGPGLHWTWPRPFSEILKLPAERVQTLEVDTFWHNRGDQPDDAMMPPSLRPDREGYAITGDANLLHTRWAVRYTIEKPDLYLFVADDATGLLRQELERAVTRVSGRFAIDRALRTDIESYRGAVDRTFRARVAELGIGIRIQGIDILASIPPRQVAAAFAEVVAAEEQHGKLVNDAEAYASRTRNEAEGNAARIRLEGESQKSRMIGELASQADYFEKVLVQYQANPAVVRRALLQNAIATALAGVQQKFVVRGGSNSEIRLQLSPERKKIGEK